MVETDSSTGGMRIHLRILIVYHQAQSSLQVLLFYVLVLFMDCSIALFSLKNTGSTLPDRIRSRSMAALGCFASD